MHSKIALDGECGGVKMKIPDTAAAGQSNAQAVNGTTNLVLELPSIVSNDYNCSKDFDLDTYTFSTNISSILSTPTILSKLAYPSATPPATKLAPSLSNELDSQFD
ncbi:unnamed protein product [Rhizoctonia solani]|uniref:Uncharacterized protein n=1 Tax=Rhizoctonia solani TaxID=456999 RepID=A0A8H3A5A5_9AGAM|nr:unnamed protein product [Rhizoctonia solani]